MTEDLRAKARELLESGEVSLVIGWQDTGHKGRTTPLLARTPEEAEKLVWHEGCRQNLMRFLTEPGILGKGRVAVTAKPCDIRSAAVLIQEKRLAREDIIILGVACRGVGDPIPDKCHGCDGSSLLAADYVFGDVGQGPDDLDPLGEEVARLMAMSPEERRRFWQGHFDRCLRCYACRSACPQCYCNRCVADMNMPQWVESSPRPRGNFAWNIIRAFHLAGRCSGCGECERACPAGIPLMLLNRRLSDVVKERYGYTAGESWEGEPVLAVFREDDTDEFVR